VKVEVEVEVEWRGGREEVGEERWKKTLPKKGRCIRRKRSQLSGMRDVKFTSMWGRREWGGVLWEGVELRKEGARQSEVGEGGRGGEGSGGVVHSMLRETRKWPLASTAPLPPSVLFSPRADTLQSPEKSSRVEFY
jgi:hypothetical protein